MITATFGYADLETGFGRTGDRFGLAAFLGADAGIGARGIDQGQHRNSKWSAIVIRRAALR